MNRDIVGIYNSLSEAAKAGNFDASHIKKVLSGKRKKHKGFYWEYGEGGFDFPEAKGETRYSEFTDDKGILSGKTSTAITSKDDAVEFFNVDESEWKVDRYHVNTWGPPGKQSYQVKLFLSRKGASENLLAELTEKVKNHKPRPAYKSVSEFGNTITVELADFHMGAEVKNLSNIHDFDINILSDYLNEITRIVNSYKAESVVYNIHGDFVESITGMNHDDSWKEMGQGMYGADIIILANEIIGGKLIQQTKNVSQINIVAGNHDRITRSYKGDARGEAAKLFAWLLKKDFPDIQVNFDFLVLSQVIDGINHIMTHGHKGISKRDLAKVVADYGKSNMYNLWTEGHLHTRKYKRVLKYKYTMYDEVDYVMIDELNYRKLVLPSLFTGNFYSASLGYSGNAGFVITYNNGKGVPNINDYTI